MNVSNLSDLLQRSTSFAPEVCQNLSDQIAEMFLSTASRPAFPAHGPSLACTQNALSLLTTLERFFAPPQPNPAPKQGVYGIIDLHPHSEEKETVDLAQAMISGGVALVQLRAKHCESTQIETVGKALKDVLEAARIPFILNDFPDIAAILNVHGVHLGQNDPTPAAVKNRFPHLHIGQSTHNLEQVKLATNDEAVTWVALGPIFESPTKRGHAPILGCAPLAAATKATPKPVIAIGGLTTPLHAFEIAKNGAIYGAVLSALAQQKNTRFNALCMGLGFWLGRAPHLESS